MSLSLTFYLGDSIEIECGGKKMKIEITRCTKSRSRLVFTAEPEFKIGRIQTPYGEPREKQKESELD